MDRRIASLGIAALLGALLSSCGGAQAVTSPTALPTVPAQSTATLGATLCPQAQNVWTERNRAEVNEPGGVAWAAYRSLHARTHRCVDLAG